MLLFRPKRTYGGPRPRPLTNQSTTDKPMNLNSVRKSWAALALFLGVGLSSVAVAQTAPAAAPAVPPEVNMEKFVVTGTNIPTAADALAIPVMVVGPQQIQASGVETNVLDVLRKTMPMFAGNGNVGAENATINSNATFGGSTLALHNLSTLVLINGRRVAFAPGESNGDYEFVDLNMVPMAAIERIEVLADGASAIYGSDAVGGVVNIILKSNYNGWETGIHFGESSNTGHYTERSGYIVGGVSNGKTSITISGEFNKNDAIYMSTRPYTNPIYGTSYYPGIIDVYNLATNADQRYKLSPTVNAPPGGGTYSIDQLVANGTYAPVTATQVLQGFNLANYQTLLGSDERRSVVVNLDHNIFDQHLVGFGDVIYSHTYTETSLNGQPIPAYVSDPYIDVANAGATPPPPGVAFIPATAPTNPFSTTWMDQGASEDESAGHIVTVHARNFTFPRLSQQDSTLFRVVGGLRGQINDDYSWEAAANINRYELNFVNPGVISTSNFNSAAAAGVINPFAYVQPAGVLPGNIIGDAFDNMLSTLNSFDVTFKGTPFDLPAGKFGFAVGGSYTREALSAAPDANSIPDANGNIGWLNGVSLQPFHAHRKVTAVYAEVEAPIFGPSQHIPGLHVLNVDIAGRYEDYTQVGSSSVPKISLKYQPIDDQLSIRATAGKSFSAPILYDLYGPIATGFTQSLSFNNYTNAGQPTGETTDLVQFQSQSGANPKLKPSTSSTWTTGFVYTPKQVKGLSLSIDYFQTVQKNLVGSYDQLVVAQDVEQFGPASPYASVVHFGSTTGHGVTAPGQLSTANPSSVYLILPLVNLASQSIKGWDATVDYQFDVPSTGKFDFSTTLSGYNSYAARALPTEGYFQYAGHATGNGSVSQGTIPRWRSYTTLSWKQYGFDFLIAHSYVPSVTDIGPGGSAATDPVNVSSYQQFDLAVAYEFSHLNVNRWLNNLSIHAGVNNVFNKMPPLAPAAFPNTNADVGTYNGPIGRMYFVDASYKF